MGFVEDRTRGGVSFMSSRLGAYNQKNTIVINPDAPRDIEGKLYRNPDDANAYVVAQNPDFSNMYQLVYGPGTYTQPHTAIEFTRIFGTQLSSSLAQVDADLDFDGNNFLNCIIGGFDIQTLNVGAGKILAMLSGGIISGTIEGAFACLGGSGINTNENVDASNADFIFSNNYEWLDCDLSCGGQFSNGFVENCVLGDGNFDNVDIINCTANAGMTNIGIFDTMVDGDFLGSLPSGCQVLLVNCNINGNFTNIADLVIVNCYSEGGITITNDGGSLATTGLQAIDVNDLSGGRSNNVGETIDNSSFNNLTGSQSQQLFGEIDVLIGAGSGGFYIEQGATQSGNLFGDFNALMAVAQPQYGVKTIYAGNGGGAIFVGSVGLTHDMKNFVIKNYASSDIVNQYPVISISTNMSQPHLMSLPRLIDNVTMSYMNAYGSSDYFRDFGNDIDSYPVFEMRNKAKILTSGTQSAFMVGEALKCNITINMYEQSIIDAGNPTFVLYDDQSTVDIHMYDNTKLLGNVVSSIFANTPGSSTKKNIKVHIHSPNVYIDPIFLNNVTVIFYGYSPYRNNPRMQNLPNATGSITDVTWNNPLRQATFESTAHGLSVGDRVKIGSVSMLMGSVDTEFGEIVDVPSVDEFVVQYGSASIDPGAYVSGGTRDLRTVFVLGQTNNSIGYMQVGQGFDYSLSIYNNINNNDKSIGMYFKDTTNGNTATIFQKTLVGSDGNDTNVVFKGSVQAGAVLDASAEITIYDTTPIHSFQKSGSGMLANQSQLLLVMYADNIADITVHNLSCNPT